MQVGEGTYSHVYRAFDLEKKKIVALKKIKVNDTEPETIRFLAREINILRRLHHQNIIKLEGLVASEISCNFCLVFEYMEHDLAGLASRPGLKFTEPQVLMQSLCNRLCQSLFHYCACSLLVCLWTVGSMFSN